MVMLLYFVQCLPFTAHLRDRGYKMITLQHYNLLGFVMDYCETKMNQVRSLFACDITANKMKKK